MNKPHIYFKGGQWMVKPANETELMLIPTFMMVIPRFIRSYAIAQLNSEAEYRVNKLNHHNLLMAIHWKQERRHLLRG